MSVAQIVSRYSASGGGYQLAVYNGKLRMALHKTSNFGECRAFSTVPRAKRGDGTLDITPKFSWLVRGVCHPVASLAVLYCWHVTFCAKPLRMDILHTGTAYNSIFGNTTLTLNT